MVATIVAPEPWSPHARPLAIKQPARWRVIVAGICALILTVGLARFAYTPMLPIMREQAGLTHWAAGWLATVNYAGYMAGTLLAASINDLGRKYLIYRCGLVIAVVSTAAMGWTDSVPVWSVLRFVAGFSSTAGLLLASGPGTQLADSAGAPAAAGAAFCGARLGHRRLWRGGGGPGARLAVGPPVAGPGVARHRLLGPHGFGCRRLCPCSLQPLRLHPHPPHRPALDVAAHRRLLCAGFGFAMGATYTVAILVKLPLLADKGGWVW